MRKFVVGAATLALALAPLAASAASFVARDEYASGPQERFSGNAYIVSGNSSVGAEVAGDLFVAGGSITVTGPVGGDVAAGGGSIQLLGTVAGDVRVLGGQVTVGGRVRGDLDIAGGNIHLLPGATVDGDMAVAGGQVVLDGTVNGSVSVAGGQLAINGSVHGPVHAKLGRGLTLGSGARIDGTLTYAAPAEATLSDGATIGGQVSYTPAKHRDGNAARGVAWAVLGVLTAMKTLAYLGLVALIVWRWRRPALGVLQEAAERWWPSIGRGLAYGVLIPVAALLLLVSFIGFFPGVILLGAYAASMPVTSALAGMFMGAGLDMAIRRRSVMHLTWANALLGTVLFQVVGVIPLAGWIIHALLALAVFGVLMDRIQRAVSA